MIEPVETLETVPCPLCESRQYTLRFEACDRLYGLPGTYSLVKCASCGLDYMNPRPTFEALKRHYPEDYFASRPPEDLPFFMRTVHRSSLAAQAKGRIRMTERVLGRLPGDTKVLDIGCGLNELVGQLMRLRGCDGVGVDFNQAVVKHVRDTRKLPIVQGTLDSAGFQDDQFDVAFMIEYLEHEANPRQVLTEARRVTRKGGHLIIEIPFLEGLPGRLFRSRWCMLDLPRHFVFFNAKTLEQLLQSCGYRLIHLHTYGIPFSIGPSLFMALGHTRFNRINSFELFLMGLISLPFLPFTPLLPECIFAVAQKQ